MADTASMFNSNVPNLQVFGIADIEAATEGFSIENKLGEGGYGPVYKVKSYTGRGMYVIEPTYPIKHANHESLHNIARVCCQMDK